MNVSRIAILGVALVAGAAAFFLMLGQDKDVAPVQIVEPVKEETVRVLISTRDIQRGERLTLEDTNWVAWPKKAVQPTFITDENSEAREKLESAVARSLIVTGEPIVNAKVIRAGSSGLMAAILAPGMRAVTLRVSPETSSGGFILPGDRVDVLFTAGRGGGGQARTMFEDVRVLAVDTLFSENTEQAHVGGTNVTLELAPSDAQTFTSSRDSGNLSLVLRSIFKPENEIETTERRSSNISVIRYGRS
ncbi:Flp pilus assembly protein CpaB [Hyphococcus luteus]|uniref:Flp pilus assembly protein CpaB n=1 Tax=Hyphococcus luteus TaxID=2058213 RepID=A0A2S7K5T0_9PROT|nr:Flp pilus assembly protein CpaB [Marinicaulis flavus]PQA87831.1 Flp pilus assembly protein CpaB [Marinicaulis flavus]